MFSNSSERFILSQIGGQELDLWNASVSYLNRLGWELSWDMQDEILHLYSSEHPIFTGAKRLLIETFVYGLLHSTLEIQYRMAYPARVLKASSVVDSKAATRAPESSITTIFDQIVTLVEPLFKYEVRFATPGRAAQMYHVYQERQYDPIHESAYRQFAVIYEEMIELELALKSATKRAVEDLKLAARNNEPVSIDSNLRLPVTLAFLYLHLEKETWSWYYAQEKWLHFEGDQLIFQSKAKDVFEAFILGMAFSYAKLPDNILATKLSGSLLKRNRDS